MIPHPCTENYNKMTDAANGRHCNSCSQTVVDFTNMSEDEIAAWFQKPGNENTCGRYKGHQAGRASVMEKILLSTRKKIQGIRFRPMQIALLSLLSGLMSLTSCIMGKRAESLQTYGFQKPVNDTIKVNPVPPGS